MAQTKIKVGRTVAVYGNGGDGHYYRGNYAIVMSETASDEINVKIDGLTFLTVHPKQCRLIASIPAKCVCGVE